MCSAIGFPMVAGPILRWVAIAMLLLPVLCFPAQGLDNGVLVVPATAASLISGSDEATCSHGKPPAEHRANEPGGILGKAIAQDLTLHAHPSGEAAGQAPVVYGAPIPPELPGWPQPTAGDVLVTPRVGDIDNDGDMEVLACDSQGYVYAWNHDGIPVAGWPIGVQSMLTCPTALGDLDNDGDLEIVVPTANGNRVYAWHHDGTPVSGWPVIAGGGGGSASCAATIEDLDGDGYRDVIVGSISSHVYAWDRFGVSLPGWPQPTQDLVWCRAPAVADIDDDGDLEVVVGDMAAKVYIWHHDGSTAAGWPIQTGGGSGGVRPAPVLADIDGDNDLEIFACSWADHRVNAWHHDGAPVSGWPVTIPGSYGMVATPAVGGLDGSPGLEIVVATYSNAYIQALHVDGTVLPGWPIHMSGYSINSSFAMADVDGDGDQEILIGSQDNNLYAWHHDGSVVEGFPLPTGDSIVSSPTAADVDLDGDMELTIGSYDNLVHIWDLESAYAELDIEWTTQFHDNRHTNLYVPRGPSAVAFDSRRAAPVGNRIALRLTPNPFRGETVLHYDMGAADQTAATMGTIRAAIYDADGRLVRVLAGRGHAGGMRGSAGHSLFWDGRDQVGRPVPSATYFAVLRATGSDGRGSRSAPEKVIRLH